MSHLSHTVYHPENHVNEVRRARVHYGPQTSDKLKKKKQKAKEWKSWITVTLPRGREGSLNG